MITDPKSRQAVRASWKSVRVLDAQIRATTGPNIFSLIPAATGFARVPESLLQVFAVSVLQEALERIQEEGVFRATRPGLKGLMDGSRPQLPWVDFGAMDEVRLRRNRVAHEGHLLQSGQCENDLALIARELIAWGVLSSDAPAEFQIECRPL